MSHPNRRSGYHSGHETESPEARQERHWRSVTELLAHGWNHSREVRQRLQGAGLTPADIRTWEDFSAIPVLRKKELLQLQRAGDRLGGMVACELGQLSRIYQSPGPIYDPEGRTPDYWGWAEAFHAAGFRSGDVVQMTFSYHLTPAGLMLEEPLRHLGCAVIPAGPGNTEVQVDLLSQLPVSGFVGMCSYLRTIGEKALARGLDLRRNIGLEVAFVAAERLSESLRREVEAMFGMVVRQGYGTADVGCIAYECQELGGMHLTSRGHVEIVDPGNGCPVAPGEVGEVVFTPFGRVYPLLRLATGDLSRLLLEPCACGRTALRLEGILGRVDDTAKVKGQFVYPAQAAQVLAGFPQITAWQLRVENPGGRDTLILRLRTSATLDQAALLRRFQDRCKLRPEVRDIPQDETLPEDAPRLVDARVFD